MKYALLINDLPTPFEGMDEEQVAALMREYQELAEAPGMYGGAQLMPVSTATTVRVADGDVVLTDGPFSEAKEYLGGFYLLEADDLDAAIDVARRIPAARLGGSVEIRPVVDRG
ncbi:YciI family protein [Nocardioides sp. R1-1]|uniref:YciI family protein n=1 Tax=Nocardioides sp. R1-1 TaxID=3383502 RepID=UPI0038D07A82